MNDIYIEWKYNGQIITTTKEIDYHCSIDSVKVEKERDNVILTLTPKHPNQKKPLMMTIKEKQGIEHIEVWTANGVYHQHDIIIPNKSLANTI